MTNPNQEALSRAYEALARGDLGPYGEILADEVAYHVTGRGPFAGDHRQSRDELVRWWDDFFEATGRTYRIRAHDILANDDHGVVLEEHYCEFGGEPSSGRAIAVYHMRDGKVTEIWSYAEDQYGSDAWEAEVAAAMER